MMMFAAQLQKYDIFWHLKFPGVIRHSGRLDTKRMKRILWADFMGWKMGQERANHQDMLSVMDVWMQGMWIMKITSSDSTCSLSSVCTTKSDGASHRHSDGSDRIWIGRRAIRFYLHSLGESSNRFFMLLNSTEGRSLKHTHQRAARETDHNFILVS